MKVGDGVIWKPATAAAAPRKSDADYVFHELARSICPDCRRVIDAKIIFRDDRVA